MLSQYEFEPSSEVQSQVMRVARPRDPVVRCFHGCDETTLLEGLRLVKDAVSKGGLHIVGGKADGVVVSANVVDKVTPQMGLYSEESFGPIVGIVRARDADHAVEIANDTEYGLSSAVFTRDIVKGLEIAKKLQTGIAHINGPTVHDEAQMPFGGSKASGYGRFGGKAGIEEFTELKWITIETKPGHYPI